MLKEIFYAISLVIYLNEVSCKDSFTIVAKNIFNIDKCIPYAYGNFNADKLMDIYCVSNSGKQIEIWLADDKEPLFRQYKILYLNDSQIVNLIPGDFNGDSVVDLLVIYKKDQNNYLQMRLYVGTKLKIYDNDISDKNAFNYEYKLTDEPLATDLNGDGITDLFAQDENGKKYFYFHEDASISTTFQTSSPRDLLKGYCSSVYDANNDFLPDLLLTTKGNDNKPTYELWTKNRETNRHELTNFYGVPAEALVYGQSVFADFDSDGIFEQLLPACKDSECKNSTIFIYKNNQWHELPIEFNDFRFFNSNEDTLVNVKYGDYNLDGYIDLLVVMNDYSSVDKSNIALLLKNIPCTSSKCTFHRTFTVDLDANKLQTISNVVQASFFDLYDDGLLDVILVVKDTSDVNNLQNSYRLVALRNEMYDDVFFLKVMVIPGRCAASSCPFRTLPYGMNYATPFARIQIQSFEYKTMTLYASQLSQSAHSSLQLPFILFGLGSTANFVESLIVGIETNQSGMFIPEHKEWTSIIPNSQLVISVNPRDNTYYWKMQLFMTPSKNILLTGISLAATMVCLIIGIILLQYRERKIDEKERKLESQHFHFDGF